MIKLKEYSGIIIFYAMLVGFLILLHIQNS